MKQYAHVKLFSLGVLAGLLGAGSLYGQARDTASMYGTVTDAQSAMVPEARVTITNTATGQTRTVDTDSTGGYVFPLLPVGTYSLTVEKAGFRKYERRSVLLQANENIRVDASLAVGNLQETVTVEALAATVDTRAATLNTTVDSKRVVELPLNGRNPADLILLAAGVASGATNNSGDAIASWRPRGQKEIAVNGSRNNNLRYTLDGGTNMDDLMNENMEFPFPDAVQEFSAQTSNMGVEHGGLSGGALNVVTKSGTNSFHGNAFWFVRNTALNATNFFSRQQDKLKRNQAGFTLGGPFIKNKLFGFMGYQKLTIRQAPGDNRDLTLTAAERRGDFSSNRIPLYDPLNPGQRFPNNMIPSSRLSPAAVKLLSYSPLPDSEGFVRYTIAQPDNGVQGIGKLDYVLGEKHNIVFRAFESDGNQPFHSPPDNIHAARYFGYQDGRSGTVGHTYVMSATTVVHSQFTAAHQLANIATDFPITTADLGVKLTPMGNHIDITMVGGSGVSFNRPLHTIRFGRASFELLHDWNKSKGHHNLVWGMSAVRKRFNNDTMYHSSGQFQFDGHVTGFGDQSGFDRADFMLGGFSYFTQNSGEFEQRRGTQTGWFFGDTWRVRPGLTLNFGIRYEPYKLFADRLDRNQTFDMAANAAGIRSKIFKNALPGLFYRGDAKPQGYGGGDTFGSVVTDPDYNNLAPRIGFAWDPFGDGKTSIRGGFAMFFDMPSVNAQNDANNVTPFSYSVEYNDGSFDNPFLGRESMNIFPVSANNHDVPYPTPLYTMVLDKKFIVPYTQNWSLTLEREVLPSTLVRLGYVGTKGTHLTCLWDQNAPIYNPAQSLTQNRATVDDRRPVHDFQTIYRWMHGLNSSYNALQVSVDKRYSKGFTVSTSYTWSKVLDYVSRQGFGGAYGLNNPWNFFFSRGRSDMNRDHRFVGSFVWDMPRLEQGSKADAILGNWRLSGIITLQSGRPFVVNATNNPMAGAGTARADLVGSGYPVLDPGRSKGERLAAYFDKARFTNPPPNSYGTLGRGILIGPGFANIDASLTKGWRLPFIGEGGQIEFRFEAFNVANATHMANPVTGMTNPNFGKIVGTDGAPRILQMALKLAW